MCPCSLLLPADRCHQAEKTGSRECATLFQGTPGNESSKPKDRAHWGRAHWETAGQSAPRTGWLPRKEYPDLHQAARDPVLKQLFSSNAILRPHYTFTDSSPLTLWEMSRTVVEALKDPDVVKATCPLGPTGAIAVKPKWLEAVFYAALNSYTCQNLPYTKALKLLNEVCFPVDVTTSSEDQKPSPPTSPLFVCESFISEAFASSLKPDDAFPWFDLTTVQLKESPLNQLLATDASFQNNIALFYCNALALLAADYEENMIVTPKKIPLSAVLLQPTTNQELTAPGTDGTCPSNAEEASSSESEDLT